MFAFINSNLIQRQFVHHFVLAGVYTGRVQKIIFDFKIGDDGSVIGYEFAFDLIVFASLIQYSLHFC